MSNIFFIKSLLVTSFLSLLACEKNVEVEQGANKQGHTAATAITIKANQKVLEQRSFSDTSDFEDARKGLIAQDKEPLETYINGGKVWDLDSYAFIDAGGDASPATVNPSLWRQASLNSIHGLFKVTDGVYQLRGYDLANMSIIEGGSGWIVVDPLTSTETASKAFLFAQKHLGKKPVKAILFTHSHLDHFGGVQGILQHLSKDEKEALEIVAPEGFMEEVTSENVIAGVAMGRRTMYMYGKGLARNERGHVDTGLGKALAYGSFGIQAPNTLVRETGEELVIDGVPFVFQVVSGSEAPAEFTFYLPKQKAFCGAEMVSRTLHNLYTLRGAKVRDARIWSGFIEEARTRFSESEVYFASHHWPMWGSDQINEFLIEQRDTYKYIHDQSVRMLNRGFTPNEISESLKLPKSLNEGFHNQGYYGTVSHNAKAVYQGYLGWYTANPAKLNPLPESQAAKQYVDMMGGVESILNSANKQLKATESMSVSEGTDTYRWLAELLNHVVFARPDSVEAKKLLAKVYDQLGYQAEAGTWRSVYLTGAYELRHGAAKEGLSLASMKDILLETPIPNLLDSMTVRLLPEKAEGKTMSVKITFTDLGESYLMMLDNSVLRHKVVAHDTPANASLSLTHPLFIDIVVGHAGLKETLFSDDLSVDGSKLDLLSFFSMLDDPDGTFNIVTP